MPKFLFPAVASATLLFNFASAALASPFEESLADIQSNPGHWEELANEYAPLIYLHSTEQFMPGDAEQFLYNAQDINNFLSYPITSTQPSGTPAELRGINPQHGAVPVYVTVVPKKHASDKIVDITYWTFYPYNQGKRIAKWFWAYEKAYYGDHVGDWEHATVRFKNGQAQKVFLSQHSGGKEYNLPNNYLMKDGKRMTIYSAKGAHGLYAGGHNVRYACYPDCKISKKFRVDLVDEMNRGTLWDTQKNNQVRVATPKGYENNKLIWDEEWMNYPGHWGNKERACIDNVYLVSGQKLCQLSSGPSGPNKKSTTDPNQDEMT